MNGQVKEQVSEAHAGWINNGTHTEKGFEEFLRRFVRPEISNKICKKLGIGCTRSVEPNRLCIIIMLDAASNERG